MKLFLFVIFFLCSTDVLYSQVTKRVFTVRDYSDVEIQPYDDKLKNKYVNVGYQRLTMKFGDVDLISNLGLVASVGKMFLSSNNSKVFNYGIDMVWADLNYINYQLEFRKNVDVIKSIYHQMEIGIQGGIVFLFRPMPSDFNIRLFIRYMPGFATMYIDRDWYGNYANYIVSGLFFSFRSFGVGVEYKWGICDYAILNSKENRREYEREIFSDSKYSGFRACLVYHF